MNQEELKKQLIDVLQEYSRKPAAGLDGVYEWADDIADHLIANGVTIRERGEWEVCSDEYKICASEFVCSSCKESFVSSELSDEEFLQMMKFCPHCGADMRGVKDESCSM